MLAEAENALLAALAGHRDIKRLVRTVASLPQVMGKDLLRKYLADAPALYVVPGAFEVRDDALVPTFTVAGVVRNVAGHAQARKGDGIDLGLDHLLVLAMRALHGHKLGACHWNLLRGQMADEEVFFAAGLNAIEMTFVGSPIELAADYGEEQIDELDNLLHVHADLDIAPMASAVIRGNWLHEPPDYSAGAPDAQMDVPLTGAP